MSCTKLDVFVFLLFVSKTLGDMNLLNAVANLTTRPLEKIATNRKDFIKLALENGYDAEEHEVTTDDGYILTVHRIPAGNKCPKKTPVLMVHGLYQSSECYVSSGQDSPGILLAQDCYDVWFANVRGTYHSRKHKTLDPDRDSEFWAFSVDEIGYYDIPATVDYVLDSTGTKKLHYVGFSQGGGTFVIMNSEKPEYADKISLFIGLAPSTRHYYTKSVIFRNLNIALNSLQVPLKAAGVSEILSVGLPLQGSLDIVCQIPALAAVICGSALALLDSAHSGSVTPETYKRVFDNFPAGTSVKNCAKYGQAMNQLQFVKFDYGSEHNLQIYGSPDPPQYNFKAVTMPAVVFHGKGDNFVDTRDCEWAAGQLPNLLEMVTIEDPLWNHVDTIYSRHWKNRIYIRMKKYLDKYDCSIETDIAE